MSLRIYPIRFTRKSWHIGLYSLHECTQRCNYSVLKDKKRKRYVVKENNEENICQQNNKLENTIVSINDFDVNNPCGLFGQKLYQANQIVIPKKEFYIIIDYPLKKKLKIKITEPIGEGFTLKEILYAIQISYKNIYELEESTATANQYIIIANCTYCKTINLKDMLQLVLEKKTEPIICCICQDEINYDNEDIVRTDSCDHEYHRECMESWIDNDGKNCPICRKHIKECQICKNSGYNTFLYEGAVLPREYRGNEPRISTDGIYGIYNEYLEDLYIHSLEYNNEKSELNILVYS